MLQRVQRVLLDKMGDAGGSIVNIEHIYSTNKTKVVLSDGWSKFIDPVRLNEAVKHAEHVCNTNITVAYLGLHDIYC